MYVCAFISLGDCSLVFNLLFGVLLQIFKVKIKLSFETFHIRSGRVTLKNF